MSEEQSNEQPRQRSGVLGELVKFVILIVVCVVVVLVVSSTRPLIFDQILPAVLGWDGSADDPNNNEDGLVIPSPDETAPPEEGESIEGGSATDGEGQASDEAEGDAAEEADSADGEASDGDGYPAPEDVAAPAGGQQTYVVQNGDNLTRIAEQFGVTIDALLEANDLRNGDLIRIGDELIIPASGGEAYP